MSTATPLPLLFTPLALRGVTARNRVVVSPMCQYSSDDGRPTDFHLVHLGKFAMGGAGIVFCEETSVEERGRKSYHCAGIYADAHIPQYRRINDFIRSQGAVPAIQIGHSGRKGSGCAPWDGYRPLNAADAKHSEAPWQTVSASAVPASKAAPVPHALDRGEIGAIIAHWREAALRALDAGYDIIEVHAAHGYLIHQFLSPSSNQRTDAYGGDLAGRMRLCLEIVAAVRAVWPPDQPVFMRVPRSTAPTVDGASMIPLRLYAPPKNAAPKWQPRRPAASTGRAPRRWCRVFPDTMCRTQSVSGAKRMSKRLRSASSPKRIRPKRYCSAGRRT